MWDDDFVEEMNNMRKAMDKMFSRFGGFNPGVKPDFDSDKHEKRGEYRNAWVDMRETESEYLIAIELPGINKEDIDLNLNGNFLEIKAQKKQESKKEDKDKGIYGFSRSYSGFYKAIDLPINADITKINADFKNGVLKVKVPKKEKSTPKKHKIEIE